ncbi:MAG: hypothetical protein ABSD21_01800 [Rhizomicrobium sp.]|jgi:hypothetical protein
MTDEPTRTGANPTETKPDGEPDRIGRLAVDLDEVHALLHEATEIACKPERGLDTRMEAMNIAARILKACTGAHFVLARLRGEIPESRHRLIVERVAERETAEEEPTPYSYARPTATEIAAERQKSEEARARGEHPFRTPSKNSKTTCGPHVR